MPNPLDITLHESGSETASGVSATVVDLADRTFVEVTLDVTELAPTTSLGVVIETSRSGTEWVFAGRFEAISKVATRVVVINDSLQRLRAKWTIVGSSPAATFSLRGTAHQLYAVPADLARYGLPPTALQDVSPELQARMCLAASSEAEAYLSSAYKLPLTGWDLGTRKHVAAMAAYESMRYRGFDPDSGKDSTLEIGRSEAITWFNRIANGKLRPPGIVDSTPETHENEVYVASDRGRSWRS